jgi:hypothetical protein
MQNERTKEKIKKHFLLLQANFILVKIAIPAVINSPDRFFRFHLTHFCCE